MALFKDNDSTTSIIRLGSLLAIALGVFAIGLGAYLIYGNMQAELAMEQANRAADDRARDIAGTLASIQSTLRDPQVREVAQRAIVESGGRSDALNQAVRSRGVVGILDLRAFPMAVEDIELGQYPEPDFAVIEMLLEARRNGVATSQVHYAGSGNESLALAQRIEIDEQPVGVLFLRIPTSVVTSVLNETGVLDYVALVQGRGGQQAVLKSLGVVARDGARYTSIDGSRLELQWARNTMTGPMGGQGAIIIGSFGIILLMGGLLLRQRTRVADTIRAETPAAPPARTTKPAVKPGEPARSRPASPPPQPTPSRLAPTSPLSMDLPDIAEPPANAQDKPDDLPDWLLDSDAMDQDDAPFEETSPEQSDSMPDLPDLLGETEPEASDLPEPDRDSQATVAMDPDFDGFLNPREEPSEADHFVTDEKLREDELFDGVTFDEDVEAANEIDSAQLEVPEDDLDALMEGLGDDDIRDDFDVEEPTSSEPVEASQPEPEPVPEPEPEPKSQPEPKPQGSPEPEPAPPRPDRPPVVDPGLFQVAHIGGIVEDSLDARSATLIGQAIGSEALARGHERIVVGRDGRLYGAVLLTALSQGLRASGINVIDIGAVPTPVLYFAATELADGSGVMVTGSHYPPEHNGFRIMLGARMLHGPDLQALFDRIQNQNLDSGGGELTEENVFKRYVERISIDIQLERPLKVVVDCGNGITGSVAPQVLGAIGADVIPLYADVDGSFPNHHPDPADPDNLEDLKLCVRNFQADVGIAYDGDGDRLGLMTGKGDIIWADRALMLLARDLLSRDSDVTIVHDADSTYHLVTMVKEAGGRPVAARSLDVDVGDKIREQGGALGGTTSGHLFVAERWFDFDDAIYASARLLELFAADTRSVDEIVADLPECISTPQIRLPMERDEALELVAGLIAEGDFEDGEISTVDGLRVDFADGWGLVRAAHTTDGLVLRFEGADAKILNRIKTRFKKQIKARKPDLQLLF